MQFRLWKPLQGWRRFSDEVVIIVIGVLLALAAGQVADTIHERIVAGETRSAITDELNDGLASIALRRSAERCIEHRLNELRQILAQWERSGTFETPRWVSQTPVIEIALTRYDAAVSAGRMALLPSEEQYRMGAIAEGIRRFHQIQMEERLSWGRLRALQAGADALSSSDRGLLRAALQDASTWDYEAKINSHQVLPMARQYGFVPNYNRARALAGRVWASGRYTPSICTSIDTPPDEANRTQVVPLPL
jgi:hypothetical protein